MLIAHYPLNGDARDYFGNGTDSGNLVFDQGVIGQGCYFNNGEQISTNINDKDLGRFTFCTWFKKVGTSWESSAIAGTRSGDSGWMLYRNSGDTTGYFRWYMHYRNTSGGVSSYNAWPGISGLSNDSWYHITVTRSHDGYSDIYLDGVLVSHSTPPNDFKTWYFSSNDMLIGRDASGYTGGGFILDDFKIYDHALSEKEVQETYKALVLSKFPEVNDNTSDSGNFITVPDSPTILGDTSIEMWLYPTSTARQTIWNKGYGGEGTINFESSSRKLNFYSGYNGNNSGGYQNVDSSAMPLNEWTHAVVTRAMPSGAVKWYLNGQLDTTGNFSFSTIGETTFDLTIGSGYTSDFVGKLQGVRQYATVLSASDVEYNYKNGLAIDNIGNMHGKYLAESGIVTPNILDYTTWTIGTNGSQSGFSANGGSAENKIVSDIDPFSKEVAVWETIGEPSSNGDGGWNGSYFSIDETKFYRFSVWIRRTVIGSGSTYFGLRGGAMIRRDTGSGTSNPYFWSGGWGYDVDEWVLLVGHAWPSGSGTGADHVDSGLYTVTDGRVANISRDYVIPAGRTSLAHRAYLYYSTDVSTIQQFLYPRVDVLDGTEPSIQALLGGFDSVNYDRTHDELGSTSVPDKPSIKYDKLNVGQFSEVGVSRGLVSWLPLIGDTKDRVTNEVATNNGAISVGDGYEFDGVNDYIDLGSNKTFSTTAWTISGSFRPDVVTGTNNLIGTNGYSSNTNWTSVRDTRLALWIHSSNDPNRGWWYANTTLVVGVKYTFSLTYDGGGNYIFYLNGVVDSSGWPTFLKEFDDGIIRYIGSYDAGSTRLFDGVIGNIKAHDVELTPEEVAQEYNSGKASLNKNSAFAKEFIEV